MLEKDEKKKRNQNKKLLFINNYLRVHDKFLCQVFVERCLKIAANKEHRPCVKNLLQEVSCEALIGFRRYKSVGKLSRRAL